MIVLISVFILAVIVEMIKSLNIEHIVIKDFTSNLLDTALNFESSFFSSEIIERAIATSVKYAVALLLVKLLFKILNVYILQNEGDSDDSPVSLVTSYVMALAVMYSSSFIFKTITDIIKQIANDFMGLFLRNSIISYSPDQFETYGFFVLLMYLFAFFFMIILYYSIVKTGIQLIILKVGFPFATLGLIDSDKGVFKTYVNTIVKAIIGVSLQCVLITVTLSALKPSEQFIFKDFMGVIALIGATIATPKLLDQFLIPSNGGIAKGAYSGSRAINSFSRLGRR